MPMQMSPEEGEERRLKPGFRPDFAEDEGSQWRASTINCKWPNTVKWATATTEDRPWKGFERQSRLDGKSSMRGRYPFRCARCTQKDAFGTEIFRVKFDP